MPRIASLHTTNESGEPFAYDPGGLLRLTAPTPSSAAALAAVAVFAAAAVVSPFLPHTTLRAQETGRGGAPGIGTSAVSSVFGRTGAITAAAGDYTAAQVTDAAGTNAANTFKASQTISFEALAHHTYTAAPFAINATATSGLAVTFAVTSGPATISGNTVTLTGGGTVTITASQAGNANYKAATNVPQSFNVATAAQTISFGALRSEEHPS